MTLSAYTYIIEYQSGESNSNMDAFSRLPLPDTLTNISMPADTVFLSSLPENVVFVHHARTDQVNAPFNNQVRTQPTHITSTVL